MAFFLTKCIGSFQIFHFVKTNKRYVIFVAILQLVAYNNRLERNVPVQLRLTDHKEHDWADE